MTLQEWMDCKAVRDADVAARVEEAFGPGVLSRSQISRIRRGKSRPTPATAKVLEGVTKIPASVFVMGEAA